MTFVGVYQFVWPLFEDPPRMTGDLDVAVARFKGGSGLDDDVASAMSDSAYRSIRAELRRVGVVTAGEGLDVQVRGPADVGAVDGDSPGERAVAARRLAATIDADVVVYGTLAEHGRTTVLEPEFWLPEDKLRHPEDRVPVMGAVTVPDVPSGGHSLGAISVEGDLSAAVLARTRLRAALANRTRAFALFVVGLAFYAEALAGGASAAAEADALLEANQWFRTSERTGAWDPRVEEVLQLFLGNVALKQGRPAAAIARYGRALRAEPGYVRAMLGAAEARYHLAAGDCDPRRARNVGLRKAERGYRRVAREEDDASVLRAKAQFGLGRLELCRMLAGQGGRLRVAQQHFHAVVATFEGGYSLARVVAAEAYGGLGLIHLLKGDPATDRTELRRAVADYRAALRLSTLPPRRGAFLAVLGYLHAKLGDVDTARAEYIEAMQLDPANRRSYRHEMRAVLRRR
jgi:tetratricopeptide (TPR) repeat protein